MIRFSISIFPSRTTVCKHVSLVSSLTEYFIASWKWLQLCFKNKNQPTAILIKIKHLLENKFLYNTIGFLFFIIIHHLCWKLTALSVRSEQTRSDHEHPQQEQQLAQNTCTCIFSYFSESFSHKNIKVLK